MPPPRALVPLAWLALTVQLVSDSVLFSQSIPPPRAVPEELTWLLLMTELVMVALPPVVLMPPPADMAVLLMMLLESTLSVPWFDPAAVCASRDARRAAARTPNYGRA